MQKLTESASGEAAPGSAAPRLAGASGTESSNTVPSTCNKEGLTHVLRTGIDSLYVTFRGQLTQEASARLAELKALAQSNNDAEASLAQYPIAKHVFEVKGNGRNPFAYILVDHWFRIELARRSSVSVPMAYCRISSELLTIQGVEQAVSALKKVVQSLGHVDEEPNVSRADLCADFVSVVPLASVTEPQFVTKARSMDRHQVSRRFSGYSFAVRSPLSARLYDKTLEMRSTGKFRTYLEEKWLAAGWDDKQTVWRMEFQFRRQALRDLQVVTVSDLLRALAGLWQYSTVKWLRHTEPSLTDRTQSRWPTSAWWAVLQAAVWLGTDQRKVYRVDPDRGRKPSDRSLFVNGLSPLTSFSAREGMDDPEAAAAAYLESARKYHDRLLEFTGQDFAEYFRTKVEKKRRLFNSGINLPASGKRHPADEAPANEYRRAKDGE